MISKFPGKKTEVCKFRKTAINRIYVGLERQYKVCNFGLKAEICWSLKRREISAGYLSEEGWIRWSLKRREGPADHSSQPVGFSVCVLRSSFYFTQKGPHHRRKISANSLYFTQTSLSKNKNINHIFIYERVLVVCLAVQYTTIKERGHASHQRD